jgi:CRISPR-associated protein Csm3
MTTLIKHKIIKGTLTCETGLRIGGSKDDIEIGGMDNPIIRDPLTNLPYLPGSSIKGKTRSLLELKHGRVGRDGEPCGCGACLVCRVFGPHKNVRHDLGPTRIIVRDARLTPESEAALRKMQDEKGLLYAEVKTENIVNRLTGVAADRGLRTQERVPAGTVFDFEISVRIFDDDNEQQILDFIREGLDLLQKDYLGGSGSRGYGKVRLDYTVT